MRLFIQRTKVISYVLAFTLLLELVPFSVVFAKDEARTGNVRFEVSGDKIIIYYDLLAPADANYIVSVLLKKESSRGFSYSPRNLTGDVGEGRVAGTGKKIIWEIKKEFPQGLTGNDYYFVVNVVPVSSGNNLLVWVGAGVAVVAGGVAAVLLFSKKKEEPASGSSFPSPPGRP